MLLRHVLLLCSRSSSSAARQCELPNTVGQHSSARRFRLAARSRLGGLADPTSSFTERSQLPSSRCDPPRRVNPRVIHRCGVSRPSSASPPLPLSGPPPPRPPPPRRTTALARWSTSSCSTASTATGCASAERLPPGNAFAVYGKTRDEDSCPTGSLDESKPPTETRDESPDCLEADTFFEAVAKGPARTRSPPPGSSASRSSAGSSRVSRLRAGSSPTTCSRPARRRAAATTPPTARTCSSVPPAPAPTTASSWTRSSRRRARAFGPTGRASGRT